VSAFASHVDGGAAYRAYCQAVAMFGPDGPDALNLQALVELKQGDPRRALFTIRRAIKADPTSARLWQCLGWIMAEIGEHTEALSAYRRATLLDPSDFALWPSLVWALDLYEHATLDQRLAVRAEIERRHVAPLRAQHRPHRNDPDPDRRLRVGYISADFFRHSAAFTFSLPIRGHDRSAVEVFAYDCREYPADGMTTVLRDAVDHWRPSTDLSDDDLADLIRRDRIDVLVDLSGVTSGGRLLAMARRPAPVQITAWGYAPGLGLSSIDYLLSDRVAIPPEHQDRHAEQILYLPALMAADVEAAGDPTPDLASRPIDRPPTFGYYGRALKITPRMLGLWAQILDAVPDSRLVMKMSDGSDPQYRDKLRDLLVGVGIDLSRIEIRPPTTRLEHLRQHNDIDVCLDTSPVGGGTTTLDACLMGVPTATLLGDTVSGRMSASILTAMGDSDNIACSDDEYVATAVRLACLVCARRDDRAGRRERFLGSIMCDRERYTRALEAQYRSAWAAWCERQASPGSPSHLNAAALTVRAAV
jgi:protein O-GlcNAc transferase